jgi:hypothetical protein
MVTPQRELKNVAEVHVAGDEDSFGLLSPREYLRVRRSASSQLNDMLAAMTLLPEADAEGKGKVFVDENIRHQRGTRTASSSSR